VNCHEILGRKFALLVSVVNVLVSWSVSGYFSRVSFMSADGAVNGVLFILPECFDC